MSAEKNLDIEINTPPLFKGSSKINKILSERVDINTLLNRARKVKKKETTTNLVFVGLTLSLIFIVGLLLSF
jgi:hypothetical protein|tara:strand:+ start:302 stop:517 length:216 start_codon:yes stop_codon:yes gene_type:complete